MSGNLPALEITSGLRDIEILELRLYLSGYSVDGGGCFVDNTLRRYGRHLL